MRIGPFFPAFVEPQSIIPAVIPKNLQAVLEDRLRQFPAVALLGLRQVGKRTLARATGARDSLYLDLKNPVDLEKLADARGYLGVQRAPGLFQVLRGLIDERIHHGKPAGHFLLLGSASIDLLRQSSESLAGRIAYLELSPLDVREVGSDQQTQRWIRDGFPRSFLAQNDAHSAVWRENFVRTCLEPDIPLLGPRVPADPLRRLWTVLARQTSGRADLFAVGQDLRTAGEVVNF